MKHGRLLLVSIFIIAILTTSSLAVKTVTYTSDLPSKVTDWERNHTLPYFDPDLGNLISVDFTASLNATTDGKAENLGPSEVVGSYIDVDADMYVDMINGDRLPLHLKLATAPTTVSPFDGNFDYGGTSGFSASDADSIWGNIYYDDPAETAKYVGKGTFNLKASASGESVVRGSGVWASLIMTYCWSNATITYTYDECDACISGYKIDGSTGAGLPGWNITLTNASGSVTTETGPDGKYEFCNLRPGSYSLTEEIVPGYLVVQRVFNPFTLGCENITNKNFTNKFVPSLCGECWERRPTYLAMTYTGKTCTANCNVQAAGKVIVTGDPAGASPVRIVARDSSSSGTIWFDGTVALGSTFVIDPSKVVAGATFGTNTWVGIYDSSNKQLSTIYFHTSCSQPLRPGDMYGSLRLEGCIGTEPVCPTATDDAYNALNDTTLTVAASQGVLANDNGEGITIVSNTQPGNGTVSLNADGSFTYVPEAGYCGMDSFSYKVTGAGCDEGYQDEANVSLNVKCLWCQLSGAEALTFNGKQVSWKITNNGAGPQDISSIYLAWPSVNKKEMKVMLDGVEIYSPDLVAPSATINSGWKGTVAARTIGAGKTATLTFEFESNACTDQSSYTINVQFSSGCSADLAPAVNCQVAGGSALTFSGKKVSWTITNNGMTPLDIGGIDLMWPQANGKEMKVMLDGVEIYSPDLAPTSASFCSGWKGTLAARTVQPGKTSTLTFEFEKTASTSPSGYTINVRLNPNCSLSFPGP